MYGAFGIRIWLGRIWFLLPSIPFHSLPSSGFLLGGELLGTFGGKGRRERKRKMNEKERKETQARTRILTQYGRYLQFNIKLSNTQERELLFSSVV